MKLTISYVHLIIQSDQWEQQQETFFIVLYLQTRLIQMWFGHNLGGIPERDLVYDLSPVK